MTKALERGPAPVARRYRAWQQGSGPLNEGKMLQYSATILPGRPMPLNQPAHKPLAGSSAGDGCVTDAAGVWALMASSRAEPPPTRLMSPKVWCLAPDCGRRLAGDGYGTGAAGVGALPASSSDRRPEQSPPPTGFRSTSSAPGGRRSARRSRPSRGGRACRRGLRSCGPSPSHHGRA